MIVSHGSSLATRTLLTHGVTPAKYIITDLNTNSAMWRPAHNEELVVEKQPDGEQKESGEASDEPTYELSGYAYSGGGRRVARVEVSLNEGVEWKLCEVEYPEDLFRRVPFEADVWGKLDITQRDECFCWCFWKIKVPVSAIANTGCLAVRGMDSALNPQPANMYWNPTGMMNSWWFRVAVHKTVNDDGSSTLRFEHPTMPGTQSGGWMERMKDAGLDPSQPVFTKISAEDLEIKELSKEAAVKPQIVMTKAGINRKITLDELKAHNKESEPWFVVNGEVYDGTGFLDKHPGGAESITLVAGEDASEDFMAIHSPVSLLAALASSCMADIARCHRTPRTSCATITSARSCRTVHRQTQRPQSRPSPTPSSCRRTNGRRPSSYRLTALIMTLASTASSSSTRSNRLVCPQDSTSTQGFDARQVQPIRRPQAGSLSRANLFSVPTPPSRQRALLATSTCSLRSTTARPTSPTVAR